TAQARAPHPEVQEVGRDQAEEGEGRKKVPDRLYVLCPDNQVKRRQPQQEARQAVLARERIQGHQEEENWWPGDWRIRIAAVVESERLQHDIHEPAPLARTMGHV